MTGIIILHYNNPSQTLRCLESLYGHCTGGNWKVCIVDNASRREELAALELGMEPFLHGKNAPQLVTAEDNGGYACGNDIGCEFFDKDSDIGNILILNDDTIFTEDIITPMENYLDRHPECGVVFPLVRAADGRIDRACARRQKSSADLVIQATFLGRFGFARNEFLPVEESGGRNAVRTGVPPGSCMMLPKALFKKIGWLDRHTFLYFEEHILAAKLAREKRECVLLPYISIIHLGAQTTRKQSSKAIYRHWRNSYLYFIGNYSTVPAVLRPYLRFRTWLASLVK